MRQSRSSDSPAPGHFLFMIIFDVKSPIDAVYVAGSWALPLSGQV
jgi:hypothetical protein